jgi:hypothetical protein
LKRVQPLRLMWCTFATVALLWASSSAHPHDEPETLILKGTLAKIDGVNRAIELDTIDRKTKATRNILLFVDAKVKIRQGKARMTLEQLRPGQRVTCVVERDHKDGGGERLVAFEIRVETQSTGREDQRRLPDHVRAGQEHSKPE